MTNQSDADGRITEIRDQVRDPERVNLFIDGEFRLGIARIIVQERGLSIGQLLTDEEISELESLDEVSRATNQAIRLLSFRPRSRRELETRLARKQFSEYATGAALERLAELGYVNDNEFAQYWVENRQQHRPRGKRLLASELRSKGVSRDVVEQTLDEAEIDEFSDALQLARRRAEQLRGLDAATWRRRMTGYLQRRGFGWEVVRSVLEELEHESGEADRDEYDD